jgi:hypothetical protein
LLHVVVGAAAAAAAVVEVVVVGVEKAKKLLFFAPSSDPPPPPPSLLLPYGWILLLMEQSSRETKVGSTVHLGISPQQKRGSNWGRLVGIMATKYAITVVRPPHQKIVNCLVKKL